MAGLESRGPNLPRTHVNDIGDQNVVERQSRGGWRWWWIWGVIALLIVGWAYWGTGGRGWVHGAQHTQSANAIGPSVHVPGPGVQILKAQDKRSFIGKEFTVKDVPVQQKVNDRAIWIGSSNEKPMLAVVNADVIGSNRKVDLGTVINATGIVEKAPPEAQAKAEWNLPEQDAQQLEKEGAYVQLSQLAFPEQPR